MRNINYKIIFCIGAGLITLAIILAVPHVWLLKSDVIFVDRWQNDEDATVAVGPNQSQWVNIMGVSRHVLNAIVVAEDARFYNHCGLDFREIWLSILTNLEKGKFARGGSTITQQVVKIAFLSREKTLLRKIREAIGALILELVLDKDRILEWYINLVSFGDGTYGIKTAAKHYFNTDPELLTIQQGTHLALVIPSPNIWSISLKNRSLTQFGHKRYTDIVNKMWQNGLITDTLRLSALATGDFGRPVLSYRSGAKSISR